MVEARSEKDAVALLKEQDFFVIDLYAATGKFGVANLTSPLKKVSFGDIVAFTRQLSTMVTAGLTLTDAISMLRGQSPNPAFVKVLDEILHEVESGSSLASAVEKHPRQFSKIYVSLIRAGEAGGMLDQVLSRLAENLEKEREFRGKIKSAMVYPAIIVVGMLVVTFIMMTVVMPKMTSMYREFDVDLPATTSFLIAISDLFSSFWWLILSGAVAGFFAFGRWRQTKLGRSLLDSLIFRLPIFGTLKKQTTLVEFTRTLGLLVGAGLPILEALNIVSESLDSPLYQQGVKDAALQVEKGFPLGVPLGRNPIFPPILGQMTKVGEETGKLDEGLLKLSHYFESESEQAIKGLTTAIEPIIMIVLGVGVGFLVLSIVLPIYKLTEAF